MAARCSWSRAPKACIAAGVMPWKGSAPKGWMIIRPSAIPSGMMRPPSIISACCRAKGLVSSMRSNIAPCCRFISARIPKGLPRDAPKSTVCGGAYAPGQGHAIMFGGMQSPAPGMLPEASIDARAPAAIWPAAIPKLSLSSWSVP